MFDSGHPVPERDRAAARRLTTAPACLVLMLKQPDSSKRRLAAEIGPRATRIAELLLGCALEDARAWPGPVCLAPAGGADRQWLEGQASGTALLVAQGSGNLGARINQVDRTLRARGFDRLLFIGSDCPALDAPYLACAATGLAQADVVLGPAADGGVVLMGADRPWPDLAGLPWSTPALGAALAALCHARGDKVLHLAPLPDLDRAGDLPDLRRSLRDDPRPARRAFAAWLADEPDLWQRPA